MACVVLSSECNLEPDFRFERKACVLTLVVPCGTEGGERSFLFPIKSGEPIPIIGHKLSESRSVYQPLARIDTPVSRNGQTENTPVG